MSRGNHKPKPKHGRRATAPRKQLATCPDCGKACAVAALLTFGQFGVFAECLRCGVGSPLAQWKVITR